MKKKAVLTIVFCVFLPLCSVVPNFLFASEFFVHAGESKREIRVERGKDFTVTIEGKGWYLNRYQRTNLAFRMRILKPDRTIFRIAPLQEGVSYLLFSHLETDIYVTVTVVKEKEPLTDFKQQAEIPTIESSIQEKSEQHTETQYRSAEMENTDENGMEKKTTPVETHKESRGDIKAPGHENGVKAGQKPEEKIVIQKGEKKSFKKKEGPSLKTDVYYIDKNNKTVTVPTRDENDLYRGALSAMKRGEYKAALERFSDYLSSCSRCTYRVQAHFALADIYGKEDPKKALTYLNDLDAVPHSLEKELYLKKARLYMKIGDQPNTIQSYKKAYETDKNDIELLEKMGDLYYQNGDFGEALKTYETGIANGLTGDEVFFRVASIYDRPGPHRNIEKAYRYYRRLVDTFVSSRYRAKSLERIQFFENNFYNYR